MPKFLVYFEGQVEVDAKNEDEAYLISNNEIKIGKYSTDIEINLIKPLEK